MDTHRDTNKPLAQMIPARAAAKIIDCAPDYVGKLCREGKLKGEMVENVWYVDRESIGGYLNSRDALKVTRSLKLASERKAQIREHKYATSGLLGRFLLRVDEHRGFALGSVAVGLALVITSAAVANTLAGHGWFPSSQSAALARVESPFFAGDMPTVSIGEIATGVSKFFAALFAPKQQSAQFATQNAPVTSNSTTTISQPVVTAATKPATVVTNTYPVIERTVERVVTNTVSGVSQDAFDQALNALRSQIAGISSGSSGVVIPYAPATRIDKLSGVAITGGTITSATISGGSISGVSLNTGDLSGIVSIVNGGTGTSSAPSYGKVLLGNASGAYDLVATSSLGITSGSGTFVGLTDTPSSITAGDIFYGNGSNALVALPVGSNGQVLKLSGGLPTWGSDLQGSGGAGVWATTTDSLAVYTADTAQVVLVGNNATTTTGNILEVTGNSLFRNQLTAYRTITAPTFTATSTLAASTFPYASSTAFTVSGTGYFGTASTTNLTVSSVANGLLSTSNGGVVAATTVSAPLSFSGTTLSITQATTGANGYLSSTDFNTFNNKISSTSLSAGAGISYDSSTGVIANLIGYLFPSNATSTSIAFNGGLTATGATLASTTLTGNFVFANATGTNATTTSFAITNISSGNLLKTTTGGAIVAAVAGTDFENALTFTYPLSRSSNTISLAFGTSTSNTWGGTQTFTNTPVLGTLSGLVGSNNGTLYQIATSTNFVTSLAAGAGIAVSGTAGAVTVTNTIGYPFPNNATTTTLTFSGGLLTPTTTIGVLNATSSATLASTTLSGSSLFTNATSTSFAISNISSGNLLKTTTGGAVVAAVAGTDYTTFGYLFPSNATTTQLAFNGGATFAGATTTALTVTGSTTIQTLNLTNALGAAFGGTGSTTLTGLLVGNGTGALQTATISSPLALSGTTLSITQATTGANGYLSSTDFNTFNNKISSTSLSAGAGISYDSSTGVIANLIGYPFPNNATTTTLTFSGGLLTPTTTIGVLNATSSASLASTTLTGSSLFTNATSTSFAISNISSGSILKTTTGGAIVAAVAGTDYTTFGYLFPSNATSTSIAFNGGLTATGATLASTTLTGNFVFDTATGTSATTTNFFSTSARFTTASTTNLVISGLGSGSTQCLQINGSGTVSGTGSACGAGGGSFSYPFPNNATTTQLAFDGGATFAGATTTALAVTGSTTVSSVFSSTFANYLASTTLGGNTLLTNATTTNFAATNLTVGTLSGILKATSGVVSTAVAGTDYTTPSGVASSIAAAFPFTATTNFGAAANSTSTPIWFANGLQASSTSQFAYASTTALTVNGSFYGASLSACDANTQKLLWSNGTFTCATDQNTGGGGGSFPFSADNNYGQVVYSTSTPTLWLKGGIFASSTSHFVDADFTSATTTNLAVTGVTSSLLKTLSSGAVVAAVAGTDYTNFGYLFPNNATSTLLNLTGGATTTQLTIYNRAYFGGTATTTIDSTGAITVTSGSANTFPYASSTALSVSGSLYTPVTSAILKTDSTGKLTAAVAGTDYNTYAWPFTPTTNFGAAAVSTSTPVWFTAGLQASSTSHFAGADFSSVITSTATGANTFPYASSTALTVSGSFYGANLSTCNTGADKLLWNNGTFTCGTDAGASGTTEINWAFFNSSGIRVATSSNQVLIGGTSTSTLSRLEVVGGASFDSATSSALSVSGIASLAGTVGIGTTTPTAKLTVSGGNVLQVASGNPTIAATVATTSTTHSISSVVSGRYLYSADYEAGLRIIDISFPQSAASVGSYNTSMTHARGVAVAGKYAYVADDSAGLVILDVSRANAPTLVGTYAGINAYNIALSGRYAFVTDNSNAVLRVIDVSDPTSPRLVSSFQPNASSQPYSIAVQGKYAYIGDYGTSRIYVADISNPASPSIMGSYVGNSPTGLYVSGKYLYVADNGGGFYVLNVSDPASPALVGTYNGTAQYYGVQVAGDYAYVADSAGNAVVIDVHNPAAPTLVGSIALGDAGRGIAVSGKYGYVSAYGNSTKVIDLNGAKLPLASIGNIESNTANISDNLTVGGDASFGGGLDVGISGIFSRGTIAAYVASSTQTNPTVASFIGGNVGIGTTSPYAALSVAGQSVFNYITATGTAASSFAGGVNLNGGATSTALAVTGSTTITGALNSVASNLLGSTTLLGSSLFTNATTTSFAISGISSGSILKTTTGGAIIAAVAGTDYVTGTGLASAFPFTATTNFGVTANSTSTLAWFRGSPVSLAASSTARFDHINVGSTTSGTLATSTFYGNLVTQGSLQVGTSSSRGFSVFTTAATGNGLAITTTGAGSGVTLQTVSDTTDEALAISTKGTGVLNLNVGSSIVQQLSSTGIIFSSSAKTSGSTAQFRFNGSANTGLTGSTEANDVWFNLGQTKTHSNGTIATQRSILIDAPSEAFTSYAASNRFVDLATLGISGAPITPANGNGTTTNAYTILLGASTLNSSTTNSYGIAVNANTGATNNYAAMFLGGNVGIGTTSPFANLALHNLASSTNTALLAIGSTTNTAGTFSTSTLFSISNTGLISGLDLSLTGGATTTALAVTGSTTISSVLNIGGQLNANLSATLASTTLTGNSLFTNATTTSFAITGISSGNLLKTTTGGAIIAAVAGTDYVTGTGLASAFPFTATTNFGAAVNSTSTAVWFTAGLQASSTSHFADFDFINATGTNLAVTGSSTISSVFNVGGALNANSTLTVTGNTTLANATSTSFFANSLLANFAAFGQTGTTTITSAGFLGVGTSTPWAQFSINPTSANGSAPSLVVGSSTATQFVVDNAGNVGIGTATPWSKLAISSVNLSQGWTQIASTSLTSVSFPAMAALSPKRVVLYDSGNDALRTYTYDGTNWNQLGNALTITLSNVIPAIAALTPNRIAYIDGTNDSLRVYEFNGTDWTQVGNGLSIGTVGSSAALVTLTPNRVAFVDDTNESLRVYEFDGTNWSQIGNSLSVSTFVNGAAMALLSPNRIAFIDQTNDSLRAYDFDGTGWLQLASTSVGSTGNPALATLSTNRVALADGTSDTLKVYEFDGVSWAQIGSSVSVSPAGSPAMAAISANRVAFIEETRDSLRTYQFSSPLLYIADSTDSSYFAVSDAGYTTAEALAVRTDLRVGVSATSTAASSTPALTVNGTSFFAGKVGLGTSTPWGNLSLVANVAQSNPIFYVASSSQSTSFFTVGGNGNVGIGTSSPFTKLSISGDGYLDGNLTATTITATTSATLASTTLTGNSLFTNATTTSFAISGIASDSILKTTTGGAIIAAVAGTDFVTGAGLASAYPFALTGNATSTLTQFNGGLTAYASSTIGNGTQTGGLTISGGATTTGNAYFGGNVSLASTSPFAKFAIHANNGDTNTTLFAIGSSTASATTTLFSIDNTGLISMLGTTTLSISTASRNVLLGQGALGSTTKANGTDNVFVGNFAGFAVTGNSSVFIGSLSGVGSTTGAPNTANNNTAVGYKTLQYTTGGQNNAFGSFALAVNTTGTSNNAFGASNGVGAALQFNTTGSSNNAFGAGTLAQNTTGSNNSAFGEAALQLNSTGGANSAFGYQALLSATTGSYNTALGAGAGFSVSTGYSNTLIGDNTTQNNTITTGFGNIGLGSNVFFPSATASRQLNVGNLLFGTLPATSTAFLLPTSGSLGVGTSSPFAKFAIQSNNGDTATTLFAIGSSTALATTTLFSVSNTGQLVIGQNASPVSTSTQLTLLAGTTTATRVSANTLSQTGSTVAVQGRYAYLAGDSGAFEIWDVSNAASSTRVGLGALSGTVAAGYGIAVAGKYAYVTGSGGFDVFDISNSTSPARIATKSLNNFFPHPYIQGRYLYIVGEGTTNALEIWDVSNPSSPVRVGQGTLNQTGEAIYVQGKYAYLADRGATTNGFEIWDVSNPALPFRVSASSTNQTGNAIFVQGNYAYLADGGGSGVNGFEVWNVSKPASPWRVSSNTLTQAANDIFVQGRYAYVVVDGGFEIWDVSNPAAPTRIAKNALAGSGGAISIQGRFAYLANTTNASTGFEIWDLGGAYIQQGEFGGLETGTLSVRNALSAVDGAFSGGLTAGGSLNVTGSGSFVSATSTYNTTANIFNITTASSTSSIFSVLGNNNVGIGTTTPWARLSVDTSTLASGVPSFIIGSSTRTDFMVTQGGAVGVGTSSPFAKFSIFAGGDYTAQAASTLFAIGSTTAGSATTTLFSISSTGTTTLGRFGSCNTTSALTTDASGNIICGAITSTGDGVGSWFTATTFGSTAANATSTLTGFTNGIYALASSTIGAGSQATGLTISGGATTTGNAYFAGNVVVGTTSSAALFAVSGTGASTDFRIERTTSSNYLSITAPGGNSTASTFGVNGTSILTMGIAGPAGAGRYVGVGSTTPYANFSIGAPNGDVSRTLFAISSSTASTQTSLFTVDNTGLVTGLNFSLQNGTTTNLAISNISSDSILKTTTGGAIVAAVAETDYATLTTVASAYPFALTGNSTSTLTQFNGGLTAFASSTIGAGGQTTGLTISGGATTTGNLKVNGSASVVGTVDAATITFSSSLAGSVPLIRATGGSASSPTYGFNTDGNTGIFTPGADTLGFTTGGTEKLRITSTGALGVGTTSPFAGLSLHASTNYDFGTTLFAIASSTASATSTLFSVSNTGSTTIANGIDISNGCFAMNGSCLVSATFTYPFPNAATSTLLTFSGGLLSTASTTIGAGGQATGLTISGGATTTGSFVVTGAYASTTKFYANGLTTCQGGSVLTYDGAGTFGCATDQTAAGGWPFTPTTFGSTAANATSTLIGFTQGIYALASSTIGNGTRTGGLTISGGATTTATSTLAGLLVTSGNVGIGTLTPSYLLDVSGTLHASGAATLEGGLTLSGGLTLNSGGAGTATVSVNPSGVVTLNSSDTINGSFKYTFGGTEFARLQANGNFGLGTTSPYAKLSVFAGGDYLASAPSTLFAIGSTTAGTATTTLFSILSSGNVGIGTSSPGSRLSLTQAASVAQFTLAYDSSNATFMRTDSVGDLWIVPSGTDAYMTNGNLWVCTGGSITSNACPSGTPSGAGNLIVQSRIGVGTSTPSTALTVYSTSANAAIFGDNTAAVALGQGTSEATIQGYTTTSGTASANLNIQPGGGFVGIATTSPWGMFSINPVATNGTAPSFVIGSSTATRFIVTNAGNVGIGTTTPSQQLSVGGKLFVGNGAPTGMGTATSTFQGDVLITGKLDVSTIDPVYTIDGTKYATYGLSSIGIKEEMSTTITLATKNTQGKYEHDINFSDVEKGSDLWLFYQVTTFGEGWKDLVANLTPGFDGTVHYVKDPATNTLRIVGDAPGEVSVRLISSRFDAHAWPNLRPDQNSGFGGFQLQSK